MVVLGIVGSPRKNGRTNRLIDAALEGADSKGAETKKIYLVDYEVKQFKGLDGPGEANTYCPEELSKLAEEAEAIILGAPVYWGDINGLTKDFMDTVRISNSSSKPALGTAIAGGSGKGLLSGVQTIYHFFFHKQMRAIEPIPVSRFNIEESIGKLRIGGARLASMTKEKDPAPRKMSDEYWPEVTAEYAALSYLKCDPVDEFIMLAQQLVKLSTNDKVGKAKAELEKAITLTAQGKRSDAARHAVKSYQILYFPA